MVDVGDVRLGSLRFAGQDKVKAVAVFPRRQEVKQASERSQPKQAAKAPNASYAPYGTLLVTLFVQPTRASENKTGLLNSKK